MSIKVMTHVWEHSQHKGSALLLLLALADHAHDDGGGARPSVRTMAKKIRMAPRTVHNLLDTLIASGELVDTGELGPNRVHVYRVVMPEPAAKDVQTLHRGKVCRGAKNDAPAVQLSTPGSATASADKPSVNRQGEPSEVKGGGTRPRTTRPVRQVTPAPKPPPQAEERRRAVEAHPLYPALVRFVGAPPAMDPEVEEWQARLDQLLAGGATAEGIDRRGEVYWPDRARTPAALVNHWATLGARLDAPAAPARASPAPGGTRQQGGRGAEALATLRAWRPPEERGGEPWSGESSTGSRSGLLPTGRSGAT